MHIHSIEVDEAGIAMIYLEPPTEGLSVRQYEVVHRKVIMDVARDGRPVALEILDPKITEKFFGAAVKAISKAFDLQLT
jgi:hypothetical protein